MEVIGEATDGGQALTLVAALQPDVVLMAVQLPTVNGIAATHHIHTLDRSITIILFAPVLYDDDAEAAQRAGATQYMRADAGPTEILQAIRATNQVD